MTGLEEIKLKTKRIRKKVIMFPGFEGDQKYEIRGNGFTSQGMADGVVLHECDL
jgi:hypothetical protein